jgi:hypothetical protein
LPSWQRVWRSAVPAWIATAHTTASTALPNFGQGTIAGELDHAPVVLGDQGCLELDPMRLEPRERARLVGTNEKAVPQQCELSLAHLWQSRV